MASAQDTVRVPQTELRGDTASVPSAIQKGVRVLDAAVVSDTRAGARSPLTATTLSRQELRDEKAAVSVPFMLELQPSVVVSGENGRMGGTSMRIRGVDGSRINVNINGITLNDPESQSVFWYNIPNLGGMAQSLQIQRGIGASNGGSAAFGGAVNLVTLYPDTKPYGEADISIGSWNTRQYSIAAGTGVGWKDCSLDVQYNGQTSDGFVRGGGADQQSLYLCANRYTERSLLKLLAILGTQKTGITWNGESAEDLDRDPAYNSAGQYSDERGNICYYPNETDNYNQRRYQLYYSLMMAPRWTMKAVADFTHGDGYYEQYKCGKGFSKFYLPREGRSDFVTRKQERNGNLTGSLSAQYQSQRLSFAAGEMAQYYANDHFGNVIWCKDSSGFDQQPFEWYRNKGVKIESSTFARATFSPNGRIDIYADMQMRIVDYRINGFADDLFDIDFRQLYPFFNPKVGANWNPSKHHRLYLAAGLSHREPTRSDIKDAVGRGDTVKSEALIDLELGYRFQGQRATASAGGYAMLYKDQLTPSGNLSSSGYALMENVEKSYRVGLELAGGWKAVEWVRIDANLTLSANKILDYLYTDFAEGETELHTYRGTTDLSFSPALVSAAMATFSPIEDMKIQLSGKYVGSQYLDNTSRDCYRQPAYWLLNLKVGYTWHLCGEREIEAQIAANNLLNRQYRIGAWAGDDYWDGYHHYCGWYQQPGFNLTARLALRL